MRTESDKRTVYKTDCSDSISLKNAYKEGKEILAKAGITEADLDAWYLLEFVTGITKARYWSMRQISIVPGIMHIWMKFWIKRQNHVIWRCVPNVHSIFHCSILQEVRNLWGLNFW